MGVGAGGGEVGYVVGSVVVVVVHFGDELAGGVGGGVVEAVTEGPVGGGLEDGGGEGEGFGEFVGGVGVEGVAVEEGDEFEVGVGLGADLGVGVFEEIGTVGDEEDGDGWLGFGGDSEVGEELIETVTSGVVVEDVLTESDRVAFAQVGVAESFEVGEGFLGVGGVVEVARWDEVVEGRVWSGDYGGAGGCEVEDGGD